MNQNPNVYFVRVGTGEIPDEIAKIIKNNHGITNTNQIKTVNIPGDVLTKTNIFTSLVKTQSANKGVTYGIENELTKQIIEETRKTNKTFVILYNHGTGWKTTTYVNGVQTTHATRKRIAACTPT